jgi:hypothetical protein
MIPAASRYADRAQQRIDRTCIGLSGIDTLHCEYEIEKPERENHRAQKDLRAQRYMAIWAFFMTAFTLGTLIVTGLGVHFVRQTLVQAAATNNAAKAALDANQIMRDEQRPWLKLTVDTKGSMAMASTHAGLSMNVTIENVGQSHATRVVGVGALSIILESEVSQDRVITTENRRRLIEDTIKKCTSKDTIATVMFSGELISENHIAVAETIRGSITEAVQAKESFGVWAHYVVAYMYGSQKNVGVSIWTEQIFPTDRSQNVNSSGVSAYRTDFISEKPISVQAIHLGNNGYT